MNDAVIPEMKLLLFSVMAGGLCFLGYDLLLVLRIFLKRPVVLEKVEDVAYWGIASVLVFSMIHQKNSGVIRGYSIAGMLAGMLMYRGIMKERLVQGAGQVAEKIRKWGKKRLEPIKKRKKELQNKRKQVRIEKKQKKEAEQEKKKVQQEKKKAQQEKKKAQQTLREKEKQRKKKKKKKKQEQETE